MSSDPFTSWFLWIGGAFACLFILVFLASFGVISFSVFRIFSRVAKGVPAVPQGLSPAKIKTPEGEAKGQYACPHCSAAPSKDTEISPSGDAKCLFCGSWFNVRGA